MILNMNKSLKIVILYSFHLSFYQSYIQLTKITNPESIVNESKSKKNDQKNYWVCHFFYAFNWKSELRQLCIKTSWSALIQNLFLRGPAVVISWTPWFWSNPSDFQMKFRSECCFIVASYPRQQKSVRKQKKIKSYSNWSLVRLVCARIGLWSDLCALETASDQTTPDQSDLWSDFPRPKWPLIWPSQTKATSDQTFPDQSDLWSDLPRPK